MGDSDESIETYETAKKGSGNIGVEANLGVLGYGLSGKGEFVGSVESKNLHQNKIKKQI